MSPEIPAMTPEEVQAYRAAVAALIEQCLERVRACPLPDDAAAPDGSDQ